MKLKITNILGSPYTANTLTGPKVVGVGETVEDDFSPGEAKNLVENTNVFKVDGYAEPEPGDVAEVDTGAGTDADLTEAKRVMGLLSGTAETLQLRSPDELPGAIDSLIAERDAATKGLADLAALFPDLGTDEEPDAEKIKGRVAELISKAEVVGGAKLTLSEAVGSLDDANDDHWIQSGKPNLDVLKSRTGENVTRAEVDALPKPRVRATTI